MLIRRRLPWQFIAVIGEIAAMLVFLPACIAFLSPNREVYKEIGSNTLSYSNNKIILHNRAFFGMKTPDLKNIKASTLATESIKVSQSSDKLEEYVRSRGGSRVIRKVLIANNGMAATKAIISMRQWAYMELGDEKAIEFIVMATPEDLNANAEFIRLADRFVEVPGGVNRNNYANVNLIIELAKSQGVDAVWPGWGHASENPKLPNGLKQEGIKFIGPTASVMSVLGDKIAANILAQTAKVASIPWSGDGLEAVLNEQGTIPDEIFNKATVTSVESAVSTAKRVGYPIMIKASEGGGGKGIRMVQDEKDIESSYLQVVAEVPGSPVFMMQLCTNARHIEVQIVGDEHGNAIALSGRDCSTQRRFQKIFEEGPPTIVPKATFKEMERAAQRLTQSIGYIGAGTVEYLYNAAEDKYFFLELNPRLQVEHPVTESLSGVNLPSTQLQVAMGIPLYNIPEIRRFMGKTDVYGMDKIDFLTEDYPEINKHIIAARITAENPDEGFKPTSGTIDRVKFQSTPAVWGYFSVGVNGGIHEYADSQFGHLFANGANREEARKRLVLALKEVEVRGEIRTTVEYLPQLLESQAFRENTIDTSWLDGLIRAKSIAIKYEPHTVVVSAVITRAFDYFNSKMAEFVGMLEKGQMLLTGLNQINVFKSDIVFEGVKYRFQVIRTSPDSYGIVCNGKTVEASVRLQPDGSLIARFGGQTRTMYGQEEPLGLRLRLDGKTILLPTVYDPSELRSDLTGKIVRFLQENGGPVQAGQPFVEVEAMKMIMPLKATESGIVSHILSPGSIIQAGDLIASLQLKDLSKVKKITDFTGQLDIPPQGDTPSDEKTMSERLEFVLDGYEMEVEKLTQSFIKSFTSAETGQSAVLPLLRRFLQVEASFAAHQSFDEALLSLVPVIKDKRKIIAFAVAHQHLGNRRKLITSLLRAVRTFTDRFGDWKVSSEMLSTIEALSKLPGRQYGDIAVTASLILDDAKIPPFELRFEELRNELRTAHRPSLSLSPSLSAGVDLLTAVFNDEDGEVRKAAMEVYVRRVYRANKILDISVEDQPDGTTHVHWRFQFQDTPPDDTPIRSGFLALLPSLDKFNSDTLAALLESWRPKLASQEQYGEAVNVLHISFKNAVLSDEQEAEVIRHHEKTLQANMPRLMESAVRIVNICLPQARGRNPRYYTHSTREKFLEDPLRRNMRATFPYLLELLRLDSNFDLQRFYTIGRNYQLYVGKEKATAGKTSKAGRGARQEVVFFRAIAHTPAFVGVNDAAENVIMQALDEIERTLVDPSVSEEASSRIFVNILSVFEGKSVEELLAEFRSLISKNIVSKYATRLLKLRVDEIEIKARVAEEIDGVASIQPIRFIASSMAGTYLKPDAFLEYPDPVTGITKQFCPLQEEEADVCLMAPYPTSNQIQVKRGQARRIGSTFAYDFLGLFEIGLIQAWTRHLSSLSDDSGIPAVEQQIPSELFQASELVLKGNELIKQDRLVGTNNIGMLAWQCKMKTPEYPDGREIVLIANDVTVQSGSFGIKEDEFFFKASEYARERGLPRIYISSNSGARIGLVEELKPKFKVAWNDESNPSQGFSYLYLSEDDFKSLPVGTVEAKQIMEDGEKRYKLTAIIGQINGIGVENLRGSGMIAGETSRAYDDTFTLSYITGRSVGIGAYLVRLGQRTIQMENGPIILTGFSALNKLLGRDVYTSQDQLGGPQIMFPNGVTHEVVSDDQAGVKSIIRWLSYVPKTKYETAQPLKSVDPVNREIGFLPTSTPYDPRNMLDGMIGKDGKWVSGFFDRGSFKEYLAGWGKSVVVGRARLGGIPMGVIAVETRMMEQRIPADPANPESRESIQPQAGQVWFPDSAFKTAQAIQDFNRGENLPLIIFANWRGFSGGTRDMYGEILKFGAMIVDALRTYKHPVMVYIPPKGELRGGAWVVVDPTINQDMMEMYADVESRGGILEPPGICEVKFRAQEQVKTMHRLDPLLQELDAELDIASTEEDARSLKKQIKAREDSLLPLYLQIAHEFADLHDRAGRMKAKGVIRDSIVWKNARTFFYWRVKRRIAEDALIAKVKDADKSLKKSTIVDMLRQLCADWDDDQEFLRWSDAETETIDEFISNIRKNTVEDKMRQLLATLPKQDAKDLMLKLKDQEK